MALASPATALWVLARRTASRASNSASPLLLGALDQHAQASAVDPAVYILIGVERGFHAGTQSMHAAKVKGQRELQDFQEEYPAIGEGPERGRFLPKTEEEVMEDHRRSSILRCMGASYGQGEVLTSEAQQVKRRFITPAVILEAQNKLAHHHHHEEMDEAEREEGRL